MESIIFRIINMQGLHQLEDEIEQIADVQEREARTRFVEQIIEKITDHDVHIREYAYRQTVQVLMNRGIVFAPVAREPVVAEWDRQFDSLVTAEAKQTTKHYTNQFRWHLFSFALLPALKEDKARKAFNEAQKQELYMFFDYADAVYKIKNAHLLTAKNVEDLWENSSLDMSDMYFFDPLNNWTYIKPHEEYCGPYFFRTR